MTDVASLAEKPRRVASPGRRRNLLGWLAPAALLTLARSGASLAASAPHATAGKPATKAAPHDRFAVAGTAEAEVKPFLASLQAAVAADDRTAVTRMFFYPSKVWDGHHSFAVVRRRDLIEHYEAVFDAGLKQAIASARPETLFANWQGVSLGDGRLWFARITTQSRLAVTAINAPTNG